MATQADSVERLSVPAARRVVVDTGKPTKTSSKSAAESQLQDKKLKLEKSPVVRENKLTDEYQARHINRRNVDGDDRTVSSDIPPTPMAPRGPVPRHTMSGKPHDQEILKGQVARSQLTGTGKPIAAAGKPSRSDPEFIIKPTMKNQAIQSTEVSANSMRAVDQKQSASRSRDIDRKQAVAVLDNKRKQVVTQSTASTVGMSNDNVNNASTTTVNASGKQVVSNQIQTDIADQRQKAIQHQVERDEVFA